MSPRRFVIGDKVLASRDETGEGHEPGTVVDSYELIIGEDRKPMVVVEFEDGDRRYLAATTRNVIYVEPEPEEAAGDDEAAATEEEQAGSEAAEPAPPPGLVSGDDGEPEGRP